MHSTPTRRWQEVRQTELKDSADDLGFLTKTKDDIAQGKGRFNKEALGGMYHGMYAAKPSFMEALEEWADIAEEEGCGRAELVSVRVGCF